VGPLPPLGGFFWTAGRFVELHERGDAIPHLQFDQLGLHGRGVQFFEVRATLLQQRFRLSKAFLPDEGGAHRGASALNAIRIWRAILLAQRQTGARQFLGFFKLADHHQCLRDCHRVMW
jgi:hypothetical protein